MNKASRIVIKRSTSLIIISIISILSVLLIILIANEIITIKLLELQTRLNDQYKEESHIDYIQIAVKLRMNKMLYNNIINEESLVFEELKLNSLYDLTQSENYITLRPTTVFILKIINFIRELLNQKPILIPKLTTNNKYYQQALSYEKNKQFIKALNKYNSALYLEKNNTYTKNIILLHQAYCYLIINKKSTAQIKFNEILSQDDIKKDNMKTKIAVKKIYNEIQRITEQAELININMDISLNKAIKLLYLQNYKNSLETLDILDKTGEIDKIPILYYQARCYEEQGNTEEAINLYNNIINKTGINKLSKLSNARLFIIAMNTGNDQLKKISFNNNRKLKDELFNRILNKSKYNL